MVPLLSETGPFPVFRMEAASATHRELGSEPLGSKRKFWVRLFLGGESRLRLFKYARRGSGEHWSEKIASELARLIHVDAARVELADLSGEYGVLVQSVIPETKEPKLQQRRLLGELIHGNEVLDGRISGYQKDRLGSYSAHSFENILRALAVVFGDPVDFEREITRFAGLLVLDALIGNQDRHHENWALLRVKEGTKEQHLGISPSYDHASSLARELTDAKREVYLREHRVGEYVRKGHGAIYGQQSGKHADNPLELVRWASKEHPNWFSPWFEKVSALTIGQIENTIMRVPSEVMSDAARQFCIEFLRATLTELNGMPR